MGMDFILTQNLWERYGFRDNPFDTRALSLSPGSLLSVAEAFVGRGMGSAESKLMTNFLRSAGGGRVVVEGDVGVGKTTFVNYHRYLWQTEAKTKLLTPATEISVQGDWGTRELLLNVLTLLAGRLSLSMKPKEVEGDRLLTEVRALTGVLVKEWASVSGGVSVLGFGGSAGRTRSLAVQRGELSTAGLREYLDGLLERIRKLGFVGTILHFNNMELLARRDPARLVSFFEEVRDVLQTPGVYFVFVGYTGMFQQIVVPQERVRSIFFGRSIHLPPLSREEVHQAIARRYEILAVQPKRWIPPVDDLVVDYLYEVFQGRIRFVMDAITSLVTHLPDGMVGTLATETAQSLLQQLTWERVKSVLTEADLVVLRAAVREGRFTNSSLVKVTGKSKQNITKYLNRFLDLYLVHPAERSGRNVYYEISPDLALLRPRTSR
jgi:DNA-binding transcriptional ArsR family regulator